MKLQKKPRRVQWHGSSFTVSVPRWWVEQQDMGPKDGFHLIISECLVYVPEGVDPKKVLRKLRKGGFQ